MHLVVHMGRLVKEGHPFLEESICKWLTLHYIQMVINLTNIYFPSIVRSS